MSISVIFFVLFIISINHIGLQMDDTIIDPQMLNYDNIYNENTKKSNNEVQSILYNQIDINIIIFLTIHNDKIYNIIPKKLYAESKKILKYITKNKTNYFIEFENVFCKIMLYENHFQLDILMRLMSLFKKLYKYVHYCSKKNVSSKQIYRDICRNIIQYVIYILILDDRINMKEMYSFENNIIGFLDSCIDLLEDGKYLYNNCSFYQFIHHIPFIHL
uniref:Uncharacterized protein n=1 Tax=viral metagenome TaxID=1070528 RepID=A0A6C0EQL1_9ZZZZ